MPPAIATHHLTRRFGARVAVDDLELSVPQGGIYGFLGLNGAGKTTTIRMLLGLIRADGGEVEIFGRPFTRGVLGRIGALVEMPSLYSHLTGRENLEITRRLIGVPRATIDRSLAIVGLNDAANRLVREYSLGMRQRLGLALALLGEPELLILDEPTNGLDPAGIHEMRDLLRRLPEEHGVTVFLSSHLLAEVEQTAGFIGIIHEGRMVFEGSLAELHATQKRRLRIGVQTPEKAAPFLRDRGFEARTEDKLVSVETEDAEGINRLLVENGYGVFQLSIEQDSLEDIFLTLTGGTGQ
jgi:ABC-2 type transport system ATP-binding protein